MQVQVHADDSIQGGESLAQWAQEEINAKLARFKDYVVRVEVFLTGVDALKTSGAPGKRCVLETRANGRPSPRPGSAPCAIMPAHAWPSRHGWPSWSKTANC